MSTAAAPITDKATRVVQLREQSRTLTQELTELRSKLAHASGALATLNDKKQKFAEDAAHGRTPKAGEIAALNVAIDEATIPFVGYTSAVNKKEAALDTARSTLETLEYELRLDGQREARQARFDLLKKQGVEAAARIAETLRVLIENDLPALDAARDALTNEFVNVNGQLNAGAGDPEVAAARQLIHQLKGQFFDGPYLAVERRLLRAGWEVRGERENGLELVVRSLRQPR